MSGSTPEKFYPNRLGRIVLLALEEVTGKNGVNAVLNLAALPQMIDNYPPPDDDKAVSFETISLLQSTLERAYGPHGGRGLALRAGRVSFAHTLREFDAQLGTSETSFRLQPPDQKLLSTLKAFRDLYNLNTDQQVTVVDNGESILWQVDSCPFCWGRHEQDAVCHMQVGLLQEALYWISGGKIFNISEEECVARGDPACKIVIERDPLV